MNPTPRLRFAPSPTGYLHVGGARTALFNYLYARQTGGEFLLRIEDTDEARSTPENTEAILEGLRWLGLEWDEDIRIQSEGYAEHRQRALALLRRGLAYPVFADDFPPQTGKPDKEKRSEPRRPLRPDIRDRGHMLRWHHTALEETGLRLSSAQEAARRVGENLAHRMEREPYAIAFRVPEGVTKWVDLVHGEMSFDNAVIEDFLLVRSSGVPTYNWACMLDDAEQRVTHVLRGDDHLTNTPKQILLYQALGSAVPRFGHLPMILGPDGERLSKRNGATAVQQYRDEGISASALVNFLALLGWNPGTEQEIFTLSELVEAFSLERLGKKSAIFDVRKLAWMAAEHFRRLSSEAIAIEVLRLTDQEDRFYVEYRVGLPWLLALVEQYRPRTSSAREMADRVRPFFPSAEIRLDREDKSLKEPAQAVRLLEGATQALRTLEAWTPEAIEERLRATAEDLGVGLGKLSAPLRQALLGLSVGPPINHTVCLVGRPLVQERLARALEELRS